MGAALWRCRQLMDTVLYVHRLCCAFIISLWRWIVGAEMETFRSGFTLKLRHRGRSSEARDWSLLSLSHCLSFFLLSPSLSLCRSSSSLIGAVQSADSPFMADGGRGSGLLECWHVPIRATVLHYSISATQHSGTVLILYFVSVQTLLKCPEHHLQVASALYWTVRGITSVC